MTQSERERMRRGENQRKETKERTQRSIRHRGLRLEALEERQLLAVTSVGVFSPEWMGDLPAATAADSVEFPVDVVISEGDVAGGNVDFAPAPTTSTPNPTGASWTVVSDSDSASDYGSIRYILANAASGDSIYFSSSLNGKTITLSGTQLEITKSLTIDASSLSQGVTISAGGLSRVLYIAPVEEVDPTPNEPATTTATATASTLDVAILGLTIADGSLITGDGCGIYNKSTNLTLTDCVLKNNGVTEIESGFSHGGGLYNYSGNVALIRCEILGNSSRFGGGVYNRDYSTSRTVTLTSCNLFDNTAANGGGINNNGKGVFSLINCRISGNGYSGSYGYGGGIYNYGTLNLENCLVSNNSATSGGGIYSNGTVVLTNVTLTGNSVSDSGGGYYNYGGSAEFKNSIVVMNSAGGSENEIYRAFGSVNGDHVLSTFTAWTTSVSNKNYDSQRPLFEDASGGNYELCVGSQAIDCGNNNFVVTDTDLSGDPRIVNNVVDLGAYEFQKGNNLSAPENLWLSSDGTTVTVHYDAVNHADSYVINYAPNSSFTDAKSVTSSTVTTEIKDLTLGTTYYFRVLAKDTTGIYNDSPYSDIRFITPTDAQTLSTPTNLFLSNDKNTLYAIFDAVANADRYVVAYATDPAGSDVKTVSVTSPSATITDLTYGETYYVRVQAVDSTGKRTPSEWSAMKSITIPLSVPLDPPENLLLTNEKDAVTVSYDPVEHADRYIISYSVDPTFSSETTRMTLSTTLTIEGLTLGKTYYFRVQALDSTGLYPTSDWSEVKSIVIPNKVQLVPPANLSLSGTSSTVTATFDAVANADRYVVYYATNSAFVDAKFKSSNLTTVVIDSLTPATTYYLRVMAEDLTGTYLSSDWSEVKIISLSTAGKLATPEGLTLSATATTLTADFGAASYADRYRIVYSLSPSFATSNYQLSTTPSGTVSKLTPGTTYYVRVRAEDSTGAWTDSDYSPSQSITLPNAGQLTTPTNLSLSGTSTTITATFDVVTNADRYEVYYATTSSFADAAKVESSTTNVLIDSLLPGVTYYVRVRAVDSTGVWKTSDFSETKSITLPAADQLSAPSNLTLTGIGTTMVVSYDAVTNANQYYIYYATKSDFSDVISATTSLTSLSIPNLVAGTTYYVRVQAADTTGAWATSPYSEVKLITLTEKSQLAIPKNVTYTVGTTTATITFDAVANANRYIIYYATNSDYIDSKYKTSNLTTITLENLTPGATYYFHMRADDSTGVWATSPYTATQSFTVPGVGQLTAPTGLTLTDATTSLSASFNAVPNANRYVVYYATNPEFTSALSTTVSETSVTIDGLVAGATYFVRVQAEDTTGTWAASPYSATRSVTLNDDAKVAVRLVLSDSAPTVSVRSTLPTSITTATIGSDLYAQVWVRNVDGSSNGITGGYLDLTYSSDRLSVGTITPSEWFPVQADYADTSSAGRIATYGGCANISVTDLGTSDWVLLGYNVFSANSLGAATITTGIPTLHGNVEPLIGLTRTNDGVLSQSDIEYHSANLTVTPQPTTLESPEITVVSYGANRHLVTWDAVSDATSYEVAYSTNQMNWTTVTTPTTSAIVSGLTYGSTVYYKVRSISGSGASDYSLVTAKIVCPMDVDGDGIVATADYGLLSQKWFTYSGSSTWDPRADVDGDGIIGPGDLNYVSANWFKYATDSTLVYPAAKSFDSVFETPDADFALDTLLPDDGADFLFDEDADFLPSLDILW